MLSATTVHSRTDLDVEFLSKDYQTTTEKPWVSVIIGKNGIGKSRLLAGVADIFESLDRGTLRGRKDEISVSELRYHLDGKECELQIHPSGQATARVNGYKCELSALPLPTKVIALTTTPFDKFRIPRSLLRAPGKADPETHERYTYLGLRDRSGRASPTAVIFRAIEGLFAASSSNADRRLRIAEVFGFLGYRPHVEVRYELASYNLRKLEQIVAGVPIDNLMVRDARNPNTRPLWRMIDRDPSLLGAIQAIGAEALRRMNGQRFLSLRADFESPSADDGFFRELQLLRRADLMRMRAVEVQRTSDGAVLDLKLASSGELGIVTGFLGLASVIEDGSLIFIDEPEISLHPEWQSGYIDLLMRTFGRFSGCHFILATHSPLILSDIAPENSSVVFLDPNRHQAEDAEEFSGQSSDYLLAAAFEVPGKNNLYLKQEVVKALRLAASGRADSAEFENVLSGLVKLLPSFEPKDPVAILIQQLRAAGDANRPVE